jgi:hypothetical protein
LTPAIDRPPLSSRSRHSFVRIHGVALTHDTLFGAPFSSARGLARVLPGQHEGGPRDVYLYVISGHKVANPDAAMSLSKRVA